MKQEIIKRFILFVVFLSFTAILTLNLNGYKTTNKNTTEQQIVCIEHNASKVITQEKKPFIDRDTVIFVILNLILYLLTYQAIMLIYSTYLLIKRDKLTIIIKLLDKYRETIEISTNITTEEKSNRVNEIHNLIDNLQLLEELKLNKRFIKITSSFTLEHLIKLELIYFEAVNELEKNKNDYKNIIRCYCKKNNITIDSLIDYLKEFENKIFKLISNSKELNYYPKNIVPLKGIFLLYPPKFEIDKELLNFNPFSKYIPNLATVINIEEQLGKYQQIIKTKEDSIHKRSFFIILEKVRLLKNELDSEQSSSSLKDIKNLYTLKSALNLYEKEKPKNSPLVEDLEALINLHRCKKHNQTYWAKIIEIAEQQANHTLLADFKIYNLRHKPYAIPLKRFSFNSFVHSNRIVDVYNKIYNILSNLEEESLDSRIYNKKKLLSFMKRKTLDLKKYSLKSALISIGRHIVISIIFLIFFRIISYLFSHLNPNIESIANFNLTIIATISIFIIASFIVYLVKMLFVDLIYLNRSKVEHILYSVAITGSIFTFTIYLAYKLDAKLSSNVLGHYEELKNIFEELLLPGKFGSMVYDHCLKPFQVLGYKLIFLMVLGAVIYTLINFLVKKYESIYFNKKRKTLVPPELAKITIHFVLLIILITLIYGSILSYIDITTNGDIANDLNTTQPQNSIGSSDDYIPFSIFLAVIGGLLTMATKDLLENYFAGISLQMDAPYEEYDRIKISNSEMLEVRHIGTRADKFYGIESNTEIVIPHKKLINESIVNYTLPTLDYRYKYSIYIPQKYIKDTKRSIPKRGEMVVLLATYINTGVKLPKFKLGTGKFELNIENELNDFKELNQNVFKIDSKITYSKYLELLEENEDTINSIWNKLKQKRDAFDTNETKNPLKTLFIYELVKTVEATILDPDHKHENDEKLVNREIKHTVCAILLALKEYQELEKELDFSIDENNILRKYKSFKNRDDNSISRYKEMANKLVAINYYYFKLANSLWQLKELQNSLYRKRDIDTASLEILDVPRVSTIHKYSGEGEVGYWEITANITLELAEQSNEIVHHISMYVDDLWEIFDLPKDYTFNPNF